MRKILAVLGATVAAVALAATPAQAHTTVHQKSDHNVPGIVCAVQMTSAVDNHKCYDYDATTLHGNDPFQSQASAVATAISYVHANGWVAVMTMFTNDSRNSNTVGDAIVWYRVHDCDSAGAGYVDNIQAYSTATNYVDMNDAASSIEYWAESDCHTVFYQNILQGGYSLEGAFRNLHTVWDHLSDKIMSGTQTWNDRISSMKVS